MASPGGRTDPTLAEILFKEGYRFDFFEAVRLLERVCRQREAVGREAVPSQEVVRFRSRVSLTFPASAIHAITEPGQAEGQPEMTVAFMGLAGLCGVLPRHYTEMLLERMRQKDFTLRDFLDLFNHRLLSLFYRAWEKYRFPVAYERAVQTRQRYDPFSSNLFDLIGLGGSLRNRLEVEGETLLFYAGLVAHHPRSDSALVALLGDYFDVPVSTRQFVGEWLALSAEQRTRLTSGSEPHLLGQTSVLGARFWDQQAKFRVRIGPVNFEQLNGFLPGGKAFRPLIQLVRLFAGQALDFDVQVILKANEVPNCRLVKPGPGSLRLGWSSWLKTRKFTYDPADVVLGIHLTRIDTSPYEGVAPQSVGGAV